MNRLPVLFVHGYPLDRRMWRHQHELAPDYEILTFDLPGFGRSSIGPFTTPGADKPVPHPASSSQGHPAPASLSLYAGSVLKELETHGIERAVLVGMSMGGYILFECWRRFPKRIAALVLTDTRAEADPPEGRTKRYAAIEGLQRGESATYVSTLFDGLVAPARRGDGALRTDVMAMMRDAGPEGLIHALAAMAERPDSRPLLPTIQVPSLVLVGAEDAITPPPLARAMADAIPGSELHVIPGAGHLAPLERPNEFNEHLRRFLRKLSV